MLELNDDMDELLRRAAEGYPLNTANAQFDKVLDGIKATDAKVEHERFKKRHLLWLLLLIPMAIVGEMMMKQGNSDKVPKKVANNKVNAEKSNQVPVQPTGKVNSGEVNLKRNEPAMVQPAIIAKHNNVDNVNGQASLKHAGNTKTVAAKMSAATNTSNQQLSQNQFGGKKAIAGSQASKQSLITTDLGSHKQMSGNTQTHEADLAETANPAEVVTPGATDLHPVQEQQADSASVNNTNAGKKEAIKKKGRHHQSIYVGIVAGPDVTNVKSSAFAKTGYAAGVVAGINITKKLTLESGVLYTKKFYNSSGEYFDPKRTSMPAWVKIIDLHGNCQMYEIPVNLRFRFASFRRANLAVSAGLSSYIMKEEDYGYSYLSYGQPAYRHAYYDNSVNNWFSVLNLSLSYQKQISKTTLLRFEPNIKLPVKGVGIGSLPITSYGVYVGLTKYIF